MNADSHLVTIHLSDSEIMDLISLTKYIKEPAASVIKRIIYQANDSPIFCSARNKQIKYFYPKESICQPFPYACQTCPFGIYEE